MSFQTDQIVLEAEKGFVQDAKQYFDAQGINLHDLLLTYISNYINKDLWDFPVLIEMCEDELTSEQKTAWQEACKIPKSEWISFKTQRDAYKWH